MTTYAFPPMLFPSDDLVTLWSQEGQWTSFEQQVRSKALAGYAQKALPDKELTRFMPACMSLIFYQKRASCYIPLGECSWIATSDKVPFIPSACYQLLEECFGSPRSLAHLIGATFNQLRIVYCAESLIVDLGPCAERELMLMIVEPGVSVSLVDTVRGYTAQRMILGSIGQEARVTCMSDHQADTFLQHDRWNLEKAACLEMTQMVSQTKQSWLRKEYVLDEEADLSYTFFSGVRDDEQCALTTVQEHRGRASKSAVSVKTVGAGSSKTFYRGIISISPQGKASIAHQQQRALLISTAARTCAIPSLEVATHEVQCSHGSAVGQFQEGELQYLQSRGLSVELSKRLLVEGFFQGSVSHGHGDLESRLDAMVKQLLA